MKAKRELKARKLEDPNLVDEEREKIEKVNTSICSSNTFNHYSVY